MKRKEKRQILIFITSFLITTCVLMFVFSFVTIEKNTGKMLGRPISKPLALDFKDSIATVIVSDRDYTFSFETINELVTSKGGALLFVFLLLL